LKSAVGRGLDSTGLYDTFMQKVRVVIRISRIDHTKVDYWTMRVVTQWQCNRVYLMVLGLNPDALLVTDNSLLAHKQWFSVSGTVGCQP